MPFITRDTVARETSAVAETWYIVAIKFGIYPYLLFQCTIYSALNQFRVDDGAVQPPWEIWLYSGDESLSVNASTHSVGAISYRTIDKKVQEDARKVTFDGSEYAAMRFASKSFFREDLSGQLLNNAALTFAVSRHSEISSPVTIGMNCEGEGDEAGSCSTQIDISSKLQTMQIDTWYNFSIDLQCFVDAGIDFTGLVVPFELGSASKASLSVADIQFQPNGAENASAICR